MVEEFREILAIIPLTCDDLLLPWELPRPHHLGRSTISVPVTNTIAYSGALIDLTMWLRSHIARCYVCLDVQHPSRLPGHEVLIAPV